MLAHGVFAPLLRVDPGYSDAPSVSSEASDEARAAAATGSGDGRLRVAALDAAERAVAHDAVGDLQDARDLGERLGRRGEEQQVVDRLALVVDLVGEPAAAPRLVAVPGALRALDGVADALDDLVRRAPRGAPGPAAA